MKPTELSHIRADVRAALIEAQWDDTALMPDLINELLVSVGAVAVVDPNGDPRVWAQNLLRACQLRAISRIPFADRAEEDDPHWSEHL